MNDLFSGILELWGIYYLGEFSDALFDLKLYPLIGVSCILFTILVCVLYYYLLDAPKYIQWYHWLSLGIISAVLLAAGNSLYISNVFDYEALDQPFSDYLNFALMIFIYSLILFVLCSFAIKHRSANRRRTPF